MKKEIKDFLINIVDTEYIDLKDIKENAKILLDKDFKEEVRDLWKSNFVCDYMPEYANNNRDRYKNIDKMNFIANVYHDEEKCTFVNEHWDKIDTIIEILQDYIKEIEEKQKA